jgi:hypothetical protein
MDVYLTPGPEEVLPEEGWARHKNNHVMICYNQVKGTSWRRKINYLVCLRRGWN